MSCEHNINLLRDTPSCALVKNELSRPVKIVMDEGGVIRAYDQWDNFLGLATVDDKGIVTITHEQAT